MRVRAIAAAPVAGAPAVREPAGEGEAGEAPPGTTFLELVAFLDLLRRPSAEEGAQGSIATLDGAIANVATPESAATVVPSPDIAVAADQSATGAAGRSPAGAAGQVPTGAAGQSPTAIAGQSPAATAGQSPAATVGQSPARAGATSAPSDGAEPPIAGSAPVVPTNVDEPATRTTAHAARAAAGSATSRAPASPVPSANESAAPAATRSETPPIDDDAATSSKEKRASGHAASDAVPDTPAESTSLPEKARVADVPGSDGGAARSDASPTEEHTATVGNVASSDATGSERDDAPEKASPTGERTPSASAASAGRTPASPASATDAATTRGDASFDTRLEVSARTEALEPSDRHVRSNETNRYEAASQRTSTWRAAATPSGTAELPSWIERVSATRHALERGSSVIHFELEPRDLGRIEVRLSFGREGLHARIHAEHEDARTLIANQQPALAASLERNEVRLASFLVDLGLSSDDRQRSRHPLEDEFLLGSSLLAGEAESADEPELHVAPLARLLSVRA
ncbi:MAG: hypothetical protein FJ144_03495 [Deltaproteobacteria bacterium]|nr:hypothetical protein [Deltaproteobacteria bacterium]